MLATLLHAVPPFLLFALTAAMVWVIVSDAVHYIISNPLNLFILGLYIIAVVALPIPMSVWLPAIGVAAIILVVGLGMFALGLMGGGDIKLLVVLSLWTGGSMVTLQFIFLTALFGGLLVFVVLLLRFLAAPLWVKIRPAHNLPRLLTRKQPVPYGIAIAAAFLWLLWIGNITGIGPKHVETTLPTKAATTSTEKGKP